MTDPVEVISLDINFKDDTLTAVENKRCNILVLVDQHFFDLELMSRLVTSLEKRYDQLISK